jgi:hypothetical protein
MSDCPNVEIRELLPEYLHDRLTASDRARVEAHLASCEECTAELATLRAVRQAYAHVPAIDSAPILRALPRPSRKVTARGSSRRFKAWRIAAAISFISLGGTSLIIARSFFDTESTGRPSDSAEHVVRISEGADSMVLSPGQPAPGRARPSISFGGGVSDLATEDLEKLLGAIESLEAAPPVEPDVVPQSDAGRAKSNRSGD